MTGRQWLLGQYDGREVLSAFRKEVVLGDLDGAIYWANVMLTHGGQSAQRLLAKQCWIIAAEVVDDSAVTVRAFAVHQMAGVVPETDHLFFLVGQMCRARKWWETEQGREVDRAWSRAIGDLRDPARRREVPPYALDRHTRRGWDVKRQNGWWDDRFSGTDLGRTKTSYMFQRDGVIDADSRVECDSDGVADEGFWSVWRERKRLEGGDYSPPPDHEPEPLTLLDEGEEA
ncbi:hypothetical protein AERO_08205 [Aeromicrobium fastidiosum]|uniref:hypothetical protein n=1 Tax=Aeromicrobium fastidiosum TaxID=52699 RepID=UPI0020237022|nr:hypothetical protein [Aeromicrobium fastidiosum]MCL8251364.1 hypothetical protein [Aeromicrobium fastidiosum]